MKISTVYYRTRWDSLKSINIVVLNKFAEKQLTKLPKNIKEALRYWAETIERIGVREVRKLPGYHDEPLHGDRKGQRSVRLNKAYRVIYIEKNDSIEITVVEVNKHEY